MKKIIVLVTLFFWHITIYSQSGQVDPSFGSKGIVRAEFGIGVDNDTKGTTIVPLPDGSTIVIGFTYGGSFLLKIHEDGTRDENYGYKGYLSMNKIPSYNIVAAALQTGGKILLTGALVVPYYSGFNLVRINIDGTLDSSFGTHGVQTTDFGTAYQEVSSMAVQSDGKIVLAGYAGIDNTGTDSKAVVARYNADGSSDTTFSSDGKLITNLRLYNLYNNWPNNHIPSSLAVQGDGKIIIAAQSTIARFNKNGSPDKSFSGDGKAEHDFGPGLNYNSVAVQPDGKIVATGSLDESPFATIRYTSNGTPDKSFSGDGKQVVDFSSPETGFPASVPFAVSVQNDGKIVVAGNYSYADDYGYTNGFAILRYNIDGRTDTGFAQGGKLVGYANLNAVVFNPGGNMLVIGTASGGGCGRLDFDCNNYLFVIKYINGDTDPSFHIVQGQYPNVNTNYVSTAIQGDGKIVAIGSSPGADGDVFTMARYNTDGRSDSTFAHGGVYFGDLSATSLAIQRDQKIVVAGNRVNGIKDNMTIARFNSDGSLDSTLNRVGSAEIYFRNHYAYGVAVGDDGKIVVVGGIKKTKFDSYLESDFEVFRLNANGSLDTTFSSDGKQTTNFGSAEISTGVAIQHDGRIVVSGTIKTGNTYHFALARYNTDGSLDKCFSEDGKQTIDFGARDVASSIALQPDGKILIAGSTGLLDTIDYNYINNFAIARYNADGTPDTSFSGDGKQTTDFNNDDNATSLAIQTNGKIVVAGYSQLQNNYRVSDIAICRYNIDGSPDPEFADHGKQLTELVWGHNRLLAIAINDNKLYGAGFASYSGSIGIIGRFILDNKPTPPTVHLTTPVNNATYLAGANVYLNVTATDTDGTISKVEFYNGSKLLHSTNDTPYYFKWPHVHLGRYSLTAKATDNTGLVTTSDTVHISVVPNKPPTVTIMSPVDGKTFFTGTTVQLQAAASDTDGRIYWFKFYVDTSLLVTLNGVPFTYEYTFTDTGTFVITAKVMDNWGAITTSVPIRIRVVPGLPPSPPAIALTTPLNNATYLGGANVYLNATASDADGKISKVEFYNGSNLLYSTNDTPYYFKWPHVRLGSYTLTAKATDNTGLVTTSDSVHIDVVPNKPPSVSIINPLDGATSVAGTTLNLQAIASDTDGRIFWFEFYSGTTLLTRLNQAPYRFNYKVTDTGTYIITAKVMDNWGAITTSEPIKVTVVPNSGLPVSRKRSSTGKGAGTGHLLSIVLAPNPVKKILNVYTTGFQEKKRSAISILSTSGVILQTKVLNNIAATIQLDVSFLARGVYILKINSDDKIMYRQFVKI